MARSAARRARERQGTVRGGSVFAAKPKGGVSVRAAAVLVCSRRSGGQNREGSTDGAQALRRRTGRRSGCVKYSTVRWHEPKCLESPNNPAAAIAPSQGIMIETASPNRIAKVNSSTYRNINPVTYSMPITCPEKSALHRRIPLTKQVDTNKYPIIKKDISITAPIGSSGV